MGAVTTPTYFFDTYALHEIAVGSPNYRKYAHGISLVTTRMNLMELHYTLMRKYGKKAAERYYDELVEFVVEITDDIVKQASECRLSLKKRKLSYIDCLGYVLARSMHIKFLTGDKEFADLENVEYVK